MVTFLVDKVTPRWEYIFDFIFVQRGIDYKLFDDFNIFDESKGVKHHLSGSFGRILGEHSIFSGNIGSGNWENQVVVTFDEQIDVLSSIFFVLTRMEEYQNDLWDDHGRFLGSESWQFKNGVLDQTICDRWAVAFIEFIEKETKEKLDFQVAPVQIIPTFDIDNAFAYNYKTGSRKKELVLRLTASLRRAATVAATCLKGKYIKRAMLYQTMII